MFFWFHLTSEASITLNFLCIQSALEAEIVQHPLAPNIGCPINMLTDANPQITVNYSICIPCQWSHTDSESWDQGVRLLIQLHLWRSCTSALWEFVFQKIDKMWNHSLEWWEPNKSRGYLFDPGFPTTTLLHYNQPHLPKFYSFLYLICHLLINVEQGSYHHSAVQTFCLLYWVCRNKKSFPTKNTREKIKFLNCLTG